MRYTEAQIELAEKWSALIDEGRDAEANEIFGQLDRELGRDRVALLEYVENREASPAPAPKPKSTKKPGVLKLPRRFSQSSEHWRCLSDYPAYEISSHGRVRSIERAKPGDWLKPRYRWFKGLCVPSVVLKDRDGHRCERMIGALLIAAHFMDKPKWMQ